MLRLRRKELQPIFWLIAAGFVGLLSAKLGGSISTLVGLMALVVGMYSTIKTRNKKGSAHLFAAFIVGSGVFYRMSGASLPWEFEKYAVIILLITGMLVDKKSRAIPHALIIYFLLLLPAVFLTFDYYNDFIVARKKVTFNLSGPLLLLISSLYFYRFKMTIEEFSKLSRWIIYGIMTMSAYLLLKVGDYSALHFNYSSNREASGGFSGNQVSTIFGLGILFIGLSLIIKRPLFKYRYVDFGLLVLFIFQGLMTFSRGGIMGGIIALVVGGIIYYFLNKRQFINFMKGTFLKLIFLGFVIVGAFIFTNTMTGGYLDKRYFNKDEYGKQIKEDYSTGRGNIVSADIKLMIHSDYLGVGPGVGFDERYQYTGKYEAAHAEFSRLFAEHGILGAFSLSILLLFPFIYFFRLFGKSETQLIFTSLMIFSMITMTHAAMRLSVVSFLYGLAFILIIQSAGIQKKNIMKAD